MTETNRDRYNAPSETSVRELQSLYRERALRRGDRRVLDDSPLAGYDRASRAGEEYLNNLVVVGETVLGVTQVHDSDGRVSNVRVSILPVGEKSGAVGERQTSATLAEIDVPSLREPRVDGIVQPWAHIDIGRGAIAEFTRVADNTISGKHASITVTAEGCVEMQDTSTNGTVVVSANDLLASHDFGGLDDDSKVRVATFIRQFNDKPYTWQKTASGQRFIDPGV